MAMVITGLYAACFFPEFERITRYDLHGGKLKGLASLREFRQLVSDMGISTARKLGGMSIFGLLEFLLDHLYTRAEEPEQVEQIKNDPIPNRNACLHGILSYNTQKNSINIGADRASNDADVSSIPPLIPYGGFSPVRLEGWPVRRGLPGSSEA